MLRRSWKPIAGTIIGIGAPASLYYYYSRVRPGTFDLQVREKGPDGKRLMATKTFDFLSTDQVEKRLEDGAILQSTVRPGGLVWKRATASLASNNPIEDASASAIVERDKTEAGPEGDLLFFAVMDGHAGTQTSQLLSKTLIPAVAMELSTLINPPTTKQSSSILSTISSYFWPTAVSLSPKLSDANPSHFSQKIQEAFMKLDTEITGAAVRLLASEIAKSDNKDKDFIPDLTKHPLGQAAILPALSGSCAILAVLDTARRNLYVACTGDCRAVAGTWEEGSDGKGSWKVEVLSEDQTGRNEREAERMRSEHPADEKDDVIRNGRVLGGLEPTRAFGDARYKWSAELQEILSKAFMGGEMRKWPGALKSPPYVTAKPEVTHRTLSIPALSPNSASSDKSTFRFLVLATDGLWDQLSSEDVVALVGGHLSGLKGSIPKSDLPNLVPTSTGTAAVEGKSKRRGLVEGAWAFVDDNPGTHLIRNALGGANNYELRKIMSIPAPYSRWHRDDITVTVVWWEEGKEGEADTTTLNVEKPKAKL